MLSGLEQRFVERQNSGDRLLSQRLRHFARGVIPLKDTQASFTVGPFVALQNELLFNVQHEQNANGKLLDQNRLLLGAGYRLSRGVDAELGYVNQYVNGRTVDSMNHIVQFGLYSRF
ncbi:DUF2490 domain-containing protein [Povalibacter sp.]|uniref:DUF2490 domain-containing protein n=1 Tax=Povalibacter sp. TaxID=1962978 RepID=UPI002F41DDCD